ncbi:MAG: Crp/Fnr family transcriptional regulator [Gammaproteobacteria bacterium]
MFNNISGFDKHRILWEDNQALIHCFLDQAPVKTQMLQIPSEAEIDLASTQSVYFIQDGILIETYHDSLTFNHETGDLVGADGLLLDKPCHYRTDFAIVVDEYDGPQLLEHIRNDEMRTEAWNQYLMNLIMAYQNLFSDQIQKEVEFHPEIRQYNKGDIIIKEGDSDNDNEVYTLITGSTEVKVGNTTVGAIKPDEIFGAIAALTGTLRTASVMASSHCTVLVVPSEHFHNLLCTRPATAEKLIKDMARTIVASNKKIVNLSSKI